jgi:hypothetical protein
MFANIGGSSRVRSLRASLLLALVTLSPAVARAQTGDFLCDSIRHELLEPMRQFNFKKMIPLERQYLSNCLGVVTWDDYTDHLDLLAVSLNQVSQYREALGVADKCLRIDARKLGCLYQKANAYLALNRLREARAVVNMARGIGAVTEMDVIVKKKLQELLAVVDDEVARQANAAQPATRPTAAPAPRAPRDGPANVTGRVGCTDGNVGLSVDIDGDIDARALDSVKRLFDEFHERRAQVNSGAITCNDRDSSAFGVELNITSRGGAVLSAMAIGRLLRADNAIVTVMDQCISSCVLVLAGAAERMVGAAGAVGIHRPYLGSTPDRPLTDDQVKLVYRTVLQEIRSYLRDMNIPERLADDMLTIEPENVRVLSQPELKSYGLTGVDPAEQQRRAVEREVRDWREAKLLGLDRNEYIRRKALGNRLCDKTPSGQLATDDREILKCRQQILTTGRR